MPSIVIVSPSRIINILLYNTLFINAVILKLHVINRLILFLILVTLGPFSNTRVTHILYLCHFDCTWLTLSLATDWIYILWLLFNLTNNYINISLPILEVQMTFCYQGVQSICEQSLYLTQYLPFPSLSFKGLLFSVTPSASLCSPVAVHAG